MLVFLGPLFISQAQGQIKQLRNQPLYDKKPLHFGFHLGINNYTLSYQLVEDLNAVPNVFGINAIPGPGYNINIISNLRLGKHFDLRFTPGFAATVRSLEVDMNNFAGDRILKTYTVESSYLQMPLHLKFKSVRIDNYRMYLLGGIRYNNDLSSKEKVLDDNLFKLKRHSADFEVGVGADFYFEYFKFSPQLRASWGMTNLLVQDGTDVVGAFEQVKNAAVLVNFTFE